MKKYTKPEAKFEFFALSESIASNCGSDGGMDGGWLVRGSKDISSCYAESSFYPGTKVFSTDKCNYQESEEYCYSIFNGTAVLTWNS